MWEDTYIIIQLTQRNHTWPQMLCQMQSIQQHGLIALFTSSAEHGRGLFDILLLKRSIDFFLITELSRWTSCETMLTKAVRGRISHTYKKWKQRHKTGKILLHTAQGLYPYILPRGVDIFTLTDFWKVEWLSKISVKKIQKFI